MREKFRTRVFRKKDENRLVQVEINFKRPKKFYSVAILFSLIKVQTILSDPLKFKQSWKVTRNK